jgi:hypothetical protein
MVSLWSYVELYETGKATDLIKLEWKYTRFFKVMSTGVPDFDFSNKLLLAVGI